MTRKEYEQKQEYLKQKERYSQMRLENKISELTRFLTVFRISNNTVLSTLEAEISPLRHQLSILINQIEILKNQTNETDFQNNEH